MVGYRGNHGAGAMPACGTPAARPVLAGPRPRRGGRAAKRDTNAGQDPQGAAPVPPHSHGAHHTAFAHALRVEVATGQVNECGVSHYNRFMDDALQQWAEESIRGLAPGGGAAFRWQPLRVEASHRRFHRVSVEQEPRWSWIVMSSPPELENNGQFVALADLFHRHGIGVPELLRTDEARGWFLMTDLGDRHFEDVYADRGPDTVLPGALDALHCLQGIDDARIPAYTRQRFEDELEIYRTWFLGNLIEADAPPELAGAFAALIDATQAQPACCVHRDFHCRNLLLTPDGGVGVVDFQDALMGPATYDLASLLRDCYYRFSEPEVARWREIYLAQTTLAVDRSRFARDLDLTALQRQLKAVGIFARLHLRDRRDSHLPHIVPVLNRIGELAAQYRDTRALADHVATILPRARTRLERVP